MITAPVFGWLADRVSRWWIIGASVALWSLASAGSGLAATFAMLLITRCFVGLAKRATVPLRRRSSRIYFPSTSVGA